MFDSFKNYFPATNFIKKKKKVLKKLRYLLKFPNILFKKITGNFCFFFNFQINFSHPKTRFFTR